MYYFYTNYINTQNDEYGDYLESMNKNVQDNVDFQVDYRNASFTDDSKFTSIYVLGTTVHTAHYFNIQITYLIGFANLIVFLFGLNFIFSGFYKLSKN